MCAICMSVIHTSANRTKLTPSIPVKRSSDFNLLVAKWLFFWPNTIIITHGCRGCTFDAALAGGTEIKSEEMTVGIKGAIDKEADATC